MFQDMIRSGDVDEDMQQHHNENVEHFKQSIQNLEQADVDKLLARADVDKENPTHHMHSAV